MGAPKEHSTDAERKGVQSVEIGLELFKALIMIGEAVSLSDLARTAGMHRAKAHRYLASLIRTGFASQNEGGLYEIGPFALQFAATHFSRLNPLQLAMPVAEQLAKDSGETCLIAMWGPQGPTVVRWYRAPRPVAISIIEGTIFSLTRSASGRLFAAHLGEDKTAAQLKQELAQNRAAKNQAAPQNLQQMRAIADAIHQHGLSRVYGLNERGINALAAPVFDRNNRLVMGLTLLGAETNFDASYTGQPAMHLRRAAAQLSTQLGFTAEK